MRFIMTNRRVVVLTIFTCFSAKHVGLNFKVVYVLEARRHWKASLAQLCREKTLILYLASQQPNRSRRIHISIINRKPKPYFELRRRSSFFPSAISDFTQVSSVRYNSFDKYGGLWVHLYITRLTSTCRISHLLLQCFQSVCPFRFTLSWALWNRSITLLILLE